MSSTISAGRIKTYDIEEQNQVASVWKVTHRQISPGTFHGTTDFANVNGVLVYRQHYTRRALVTGTSPAGYLALGSADWQRTRFLWCGEVLDAEHLAFGFDATDVEFVVPDGSDHRVILVPKDSLMRALGGEPEGSEFGNRRLLRCEPALSHQLFAMIDRLVAGYPSHDAPPLNDLLLQAIESQLLGTVAEMLFAADTDAGRSTPRKRYLACSRAISHAEGLTHPISVADLAAVAGVSQRVLEIGFKETLGISPRKYLRWTRMNRFHSELRAARAGSSTVTALANHWGFHELGRTAGEYKQLFGQSPSATLANDPQPRYKRLVDALAE